MAAVGRPLHQVQQSLYSDRPQQIANHEQGYQLPCRSEHRFSVLLMACRLHLTTGRVEGGPSCVLPFGSSGNSAKRDASPGPQSGGQAPLPKRCASCLLLSEHINIPLLAFSMLPAHAITALVWCSEVKVQKGCMSCFAPETETKTACTAQTACMHACMSAALLM